MALSLLSSAATWIRTSAPLERPSPPMRSGSTSGRSRRNASAPATSFGQPQPNPTGLPSLSPRPRGVVDEDAETVAGEKLRVRDRPGPVASCSVDDDHGRTVAGRVVPTGELEAIGRSEGHPFVLRTRRGADRLAVLVCIDDRQADRQDEPVDHEDSCDGGDGATHPPACPPPPALASVDERDREPEKSQDHASGEGE